MNKTKIILAIITFGLFTTLFILMCSDGNDNTETSEKSRTSTEIMAKKAKQTDGELIYCFYEKKVNECMYAVYTIGEQYFIKMVYPSGQTATEEILREDLDDRIKFTYKTPGIYNDEYYEFYMGDLRLCNKEGKAFATALKYE